MWFSRGLLSLGRTESRDLYGDGTDFITLWLAWPGPRRDYTASPNGPAVTHSNNAIPELGHRLSMLGY